MFWCAIPLHFFIFWTVALNKHWSKEYITHVLFTALPIAVVCCMLYFQQGSKLLQTNQHINKPINTKPLSTQSFSATNTSDTTISSKNNLSKPIPDAKFTLYFGESFAEIQPPHIFSTRELLKLPQQILVAAPLEDGKLSTWTGVPLSYFFTLHPDLSFKQAVVTGLDQYGAIIPISDIHKYNPIIAYKRDGHFLSIRDKGPFYIIYPLKKMPELNRAEIQMRMVWQVKDVRLQ